MRKNSTLLLLALIMMINALAYGTIIPLLYPYATRFGINPVGLSLLFASFSFAQFIATPIIGRLSDKFGRKPLLLLCLLGTSASLALFASAQSVTMLFVARIIDGITGGNISVAQAIIADTTDGNDRAKAFGMLGGAFGFGFLLGPALGGLLSQLGLTAPFWFGSLLALAGTVVGSFVLKETLPPGARQSTNKPLLDVKALVKALFSPVVGIILAIGFLGSIAQNAFVIGVQSFTVDFLAMTPTQSGLMFAGVGLITILMQIGGIRLLLDKVKSKKKLIVVTLIFSSLSLALLFVPRTLIPFLFALVFYVVATSPVVPVVTALLSERTKGEDQGAILGINQSYVSLGQVIGPLIAGLVSVQLGIPSIFIVGSGFFVLALFFSYWLYTPLAGKVDI